MKKLILFLSGMIFALSLLLFVFIESEGISLRLALRTFVDNVQTVVYRIKYR